MGKIWVSEAKEFGGVEFMLQMLLKTSLGKVGSLPPVWRFKDVNVSRFGQGLKGYQKAGVKVNMR
jgi:hypothetical protein